jgi:uncharacterized protein YbjT (DUF2867 family)
MNESITKTALVFGASGLIGRFLSEQLLSYPEYSKVVIFVREKLHMVNPAIEQIIFNTDKFAEIEALFNRSHVFCCIGTTRKKAGSNENFFKIDHDLVEKIAQNAARNKADAFVVVSSIGASAESGNFYLRTKGLMEQSIKTFQFSNISILRPSILLGMRSENRLLENIGKQIAVITSPLMVGKFRKYKPIHAADVAKAMIVSASKGKGIFIHESDEIEQLAKLTYNSL